MRERGADGLVQPRQLQLQPGILLARRRTDRCSLPIAAEPLLPTLPKLPKLPKLLPLPLRLLCEYALCPTSLSEIASVPSSIWVGMAVYRCTLLSLSLSRRLRERLRYTYHAYHPTASRRRASAANTYTARTPVLLSSASSLPFTPVKVNMSSEVLCGVLVL